MPNRKRASAEKTALRLVLGGRGKSPGSGEKGLWKTITSQQVADHIHDVTIELSALANKAGKPRLALLLQLAHDEAAGNKLVLKGCSPFDIDRR